MLNYEFPGLQDFYLCKLKSPLESFLNSLLYFFEEKKFLNLLLVKYFFFAIFLLLQK